MANEASGYQRLIDPLERLVHEAADAIMDIYERADHEVTHKSDESPLTAADLASHELLSAGLGSIGPELPVLSEESAARVTPGERRRWTRFWLVDPLDGTKEFVKRNGEFTINVALIEFGRPVFGIVHVPVTGTSYVGLSGGRAEKRRRDGEPSVLHVAGSAAGRPVRIVGSRSHAGGEMEGFAAALGRHEFLAVGSALKFCMVAEGLADVYLRLKPTCEWDTAAGQAVVEAAGGAVTTLAGHPLRYNARDTMVNPSFIVSGDRTRDYAQTLRQTL